MPPQPRRPTTSTRSTAAFVSWAIAAVFGALGCGSRTGLLVDAVAAPSVDAGAPVFPILALVPIPASAEGTYDYELSPFDPISGEFAPLESIPCLRAFGDRAISMAVDCSGGVYVQFARAGLWRVTTSSSDCARTAFDAAAQGLASDVVLGFGANAGGGETLYYVATSSETQSPSFGAIDTSSFGLRGIGPFTGAAAADTRLSGVPDGGLFATANGAVYGVDEATGRATRDDPVPVASGDAQGFAFWHGSFYLFQLLPADDTSVVRLSPGATSPVTVGRTPREVVAAAASLCQ